MKLLRVALEEDQQTDTEILVTDNTDEVEILKEINEINANFDAEQNTSAVLESLSMYADTVRQLIQTNSCTRETANLITFGIQQQYNLVNYTPPKVSMESMGLTIEQEHQLILEGVDDIINRAAQKVVMNVKHNYNAIADLFKTTRMKLSKYEDKLISGKKEFKEKEKDFDQGNHTGSLNDLWYQFTTDKGQSKDVIRDIEKDLDMSKYVLDTYPTEIIDLLKKLTSTIKSGKHDDVKNFIAMVRNVERFSRPGDLFKKSYIGGKPYLNVTGFEVNKGGERNIINMDGNNFSKLSMLATPKAIALSGSFWHGLNKVNTFNSDRGNMVIDIIFSQEISLTTNQIGQLFDLGQDYITNIKKYLSLEDSLKSAVNDFTDAMDKLNKESSSETKKLVKQIEQFGNNIIYCFQTPATAEIAHSLQGSKYCHYLGLRMIYNAK